MAITASAITPDKSLEEFRVEFNKLVQDFDGVASGNSFAQSIIFLNGVDKVSPLSTIGRSNSYAAWIFSNISCPAGFLSG